MKKKPIVIKLNKDKPKTRTLWTRDPSTYIEKDKTKFSRKPKHKKAFDEEDTNNEH